VAAKSAQPSAEADESARDQFAAIGRFVQSFEDIVSTLRWHSHRIMLGDHLGVSGPDPRAMIPWWNINELILHHPSMTARNLLDIWRSLLAEQSKALTSLKILTEDGNKVVKGVSGEVVADFGDICNKRNSVIHATWRIGRWRSDEDFAKLGVTKYNVSQDGFEVRTDLPKTFDDLMALGTRCCRLHERLGRFLQFYHYHPHNIEAVFKKSKKSTDKWHTWAFIPPSDSSSPRPSLRKSE